MSKVVLGKGLEALIPNESSSAAQQKIYRLIAIDQLAPNPLQPRREFNDESLAELAASIKEHGLIQPIVVREQGAQFIIVAGERRYRAARQAGLERVPVVVMDDVDNDRMLEIALIENIQREDLNALETADAYRVLMQRCSFTQEELASRVGKSRTAVANQMRLLALPDSIKSMIRDGRLTEGHARAMLSVDGEEQMLQLARRIADDSLSVRVVEQEVRRVRKGRRLPRRKNPEIAEAETFLKQLLGTAVKISSGLKRGRIEIEYYSDDDLNRLLDIFKATQTE
ncbi:MAG: ParB/RepB/Spo0J family partition protein [bacterium]|nr:ParB/RepB/Spo0J family partition protein [bacterium]